jgi:predicted HD phosphohydrolase
MLDLMLGNHRRGARPLEQDDDRTRDEAAAFGRDFGSLMRRLNEKYAARRAGDPHHGDEARRRAVAADFQRELEKLITRHQVSDTIAEYVRHVVREGFEVDFDSMDPTDESRRARE